MKKLLALIMALIMLALCGPAAADDDYFDPVGIDLSSVNAAYLLQGGYSSQTDFLTKDDFASHIVTILLVWSTGCPYCKQMLPNLQQIHEQYGDDILVVGCPNTWLNGTIPGAWNYCDSNGYTFVNVVADSVLTTLYNKNNFVPQVYFINSDGVIVDFIPGSASLSALLDTAGNIIAQSTDEYYDVTFVENVTGEVFATQSVHKGLRPFYPTPPTIEGYDFDGWTPGTAPMVMGPVTITARYKIKTFRITFYDSITGNKIKAVYVKWGQAATAPTPPEHEGYEFVGWDKDFSYVTEAMDVYTIYVPEGTSPGVPGDMNGDGLVSSSDALVILRYSMGSMELTPAQLELADFNHDGMVNSADALAVLRTTL